MPCPAFNLLLDFIREGKVDPHSRIAVLSDTEISILNLRTVHRQVGIAREFLRLLKAHGLFIHVDHPVRDALPFWRKMWREGLIDDDPDELVCWESFLNGLECQMTADKSFAVDKDAPPAPTETEAAGSRDSACAPQPDRG